MGADRGTIVAWKPEKQGQPGWKEVRDGGFRGEKTNREDEEMKVAS